MENASKALLIAGAILICILLIAVAMYIYSSARTTIDTAASKMSSQEKDIYNSAVNSYLGNGKKGSQVRAMIDSIISSNASNTGESGKFIGIDVESLTDTLKKNITEEQIKTMNYASYDWNSGGNLENNNATINTANDGMTQLKQNINTNKNYDVTASYTDGIITSIKIVESN